MVALILDPSATDLVHFVVNNLLTVVGIAIAVIVAGSLLRLAVPASTRAAIHHQPGWLQFVESILLAELGAYWGHRATHRVPILWRFHKVHRSIEEMDWLASGRLHPVDQAFTRSCAILPIFALGFTRTTFGAFLVFTTFLALFIHANVRLTFGVLRWVISTPSSTIGTMPTIRRPTTRTSRASSPGSMHYSVRFTYRANECQCSTASRTRSRTVTCTLSLAVPAPRDLRNCWLEPRRA